MMRCGLVVALIVSLSAAVFACKVPVFRYALERWVVDRYRVVAIVPKTDEPSSELVRILQAKQEGANVDVEVVDLASLTEMQQWQLVDVDVSATQPRLQVFYPQRGQEQRKCWEGALSKDSIADWFDSPLRQTIANDLTSGASAVFLLVEGPDQKENDRLAALVSQTLRTVESEISIPDGVIPRAAAAEMLQELPEATMDDVLRCDIPLKVDFQVRRLPMDNQQELALRAMTRGLQDNQDHEPFLVPIFGRGRMLDAIDTKRVDADSISNLCRYIIGECSCTVKSQNPGVDLLLKVDWQLRLGSELVIVDRSIPTEPELVPIPPTSVVGDSSQSRLSWSWTAPAAILIIAVVYLFARQRSKVSESAR